MSRAETLERPSPSDLKGSGAIHADATGAVLIWTKEISQHYNVVELLVAKNRFGPNGSVAAIFRKADGQMFVERNGQTKATRAPNPSMSQEPKPAEDVLNESF